MAVLLSLKIPNLAKKANSELPKASVPKEG